MSKTVKKLDEKTRLAWAGFNFTGKPYYAMLLMDGMRKLREQEKDRDLGM